MQIEGHRKLDNAFSEVKNGFEEGYAVITEAWETSQSTL